jgi:hypothetical protein
VAFFVDNQAAIQCTNNVKPNLGHYLVDHIHSQASRIFQQYPVIRPAMLYGQKTTTPTLYIKLETNVNDLKVQSSGISVPI